MGKALVIKDANFYNNRLDTIIYNDIPCTGISLSQSSATVTSELTLTATVTPSDTTDAVTWSSSDDRIATVNNGIITAVSNGTATITATCGNYSATCNVTIQMALKVVKGVRITIGYNTTTGLLEPADGSLGNDFASVGKETGLYPAVGKKTLDGSEVLAMYPISIPFGATTINVECPSNMASLIVYYDKDTKSNGSPEYYYDCAKVVDGQTPTSGTPYSISAWEYGDKTFTIPSVAGLDSFTLTFYFKSGYSTFDPDNSGISFTFGYE